MEHRLITELKEMDETDAMQDGLRTRDVGHSIVLVLKILTN